MAKHALEKGLNSRDAILKAVQVGNFALCLQFAMQSVSIICCKRFNNFQLFLSLLFMRNLLGTLFAIFNCINALSFRSSFNICFCCRYCKLIPQLGSATSKSFTRSSSFLHLARFQGIFLSPQLMDSGAIGRLGRPAVKRAAEGRRPGHGTV